MTTAAFIIWPIVAVLLFRLLSPVAAISATIIGGYLLLPTRGGFNLPMVPEINKDTMPGLLALVLAATMLRNVPGERPGWLPRSPVILGLIAVLMLAKVGTFLTNQDVQVFGPTVLQALTAYDTVSRVMSVMMTLLPFVLARKYLATPEAQATFLKVFVIAALGYSLLALYEVRMSPQLNRMVYGYFPHAWLQHIRAGGFRPIVFLVHGLWVGIFFSCAVLAALTLTKAGPSADRGKMMLAMLWLLMTLFMAKTVGAFAVTLLLIPVLMFLPPRAQVLTAAVIGMMIVTYPALRGAGLVPIDTVLGWAESLSAERAQSLAFRLENEDALLVRAAERPLFGWGAWGRSFVFDEEGRNITIVDGFWILTIGYGGWVQYVGEFGLLTFATLILAIRRKSFDLAPATAGMAVLLTANLIDLIPNAGITALTWMMAGALAGRLELGRVTAAAGVSGLAADPVPDSGQRTGAAVPAGAPGRQPPAPVYARRFGADDLGRPERTDHQPEANPRRDAPRYARDPAQLRKTGQRRP
jgi:hypothetical protein